MEKEKVAFLTLGCKVNQYETNAMSQKLQEAGYVVIDNDLEKVDIFIVNTCTVTNISDRKSRQALRKVKEHNPNAIIVATGCYAQIAKDVLVKMPEVDLILGNDEKREIVKYIEEYKKSKEKILEVKDIFEDKKFSEFGATTYTEKTRAAIKIQDGCDRFCTYCIIPYARGRVRSRKPEEVVREVKQIAKKGIKEIVITGIHIASYGKDFKTKYKLIDLLEEINQINGIERIRLGSIEPTLITDEFVSRLVKFEKICPHFHLSLQSGCNQTLQRMNRKYSIEEFTQVVNRLRNAYKDVTLTTDIIVGFPGETEQEFDETYKFLEKIKFYKMHVFPYSARKGTKAAVMSNQIDGNKKEERSKKLIELSNKNQKEYHDTYIGKKVDVLIEEDNKGHTANYILVKIKNKEDIKNSTTIKAKIIDSNEEFLIGDI